MKPGIEPGQEPTRIQSIKDKRTVKPKRTMYHNVLHCGKRLEGLRQGPYMRCETQTGNMSKGNSVVSNTEHNRNGWMGSVTTS